MNTEIESWRDDTPGCQNCIHLNNAGASLMPSPVLAVIQQHLQLEAQIGGYEAQAARQEAIGDAYQAIADLLNTGPGNIAFTENATVSTMQVLSSLPLERGDVILTTVNDYVSNQIQFLSLQSRLGVEIIRVPDVPEGGVDVSEVDRLVRQNRPALVCVSHMPTNSGLVQNVAGVGSICREHDIWLLVDACQTVGQMPIDVEQIQCDFLSASSRKFLRGPRGSGFLYVSDRALAKNLTPLYVDMRGADWIQADQFRVAVDARRFENWEFAWSLVLGTGAAARYAVGIGLEKICQRVRELANRLRAQLDQLDGVTVMDRASELGGIVSCSFDRCDVDQVIQRLRGRRIHCTVQIRNYAVLDFDAKGVSKTLRLSPHYFNTEDEMEQAVLALSETVAELQTKAGC